MQGSDFSAEVEVSEAQLDLGIEHSVKIVRWISKQLQAKELEAENKGTIVRTPLLRSEPTKVNVGLAWVPLNDPSRRDRCSSQPESDQSSDSFYDDLEVADRNKTVSAKILHK